jgi:hypothetical protein
MGVLYFTHDAQTAVSQFPLLGLCHDNYKIVWVGRKPILAVAWLTWSCIWQRWHMEASIDRELGGTQAANNTEEV